VRTVREKRLFACEAVEVWRIKSPTGRKGQRHLSVFEVRSEGNYRSSHQNGNDAVAAAWELLGIKPKTGRYGRSRAAA
jgi:hypothetical protein